VPNTRSSSVATSEILWGEPRSGPRSAPPAGAPKRLLVPFTNIGHVAPLFEVGLNLYHSLV